MRNARDRPSPNRHAIGALFAFIREYSRRLVVHGVDLPVKIRSKTKQPDRRDGPAVSTRVKRRQLLAHPGHVLRSRALFPFDNVELHRLSFGQGLETLPLDRRVVDEAVLRSVLGGDEPEALGFVEPLDRTGRTHVLHSVLVMVGRSADEPY